MRIKHMFKKTVMDIRGEERENTPEVPDNLMRKCNACKAAVFVDEVKQNHYICPHCGNYFHMPAYRRIKMIADRKELCGMGCRDGGTESSSVQRIRGKAPCTSGENRA